MSKICIFINKTSLKVYIHINIIVFLDPEMPPMGLSEGKILVIYTVSQNRLNIIKKFKKLGSRALEVTLRGLILKTKL